jgi:hypothetical protein
VVSFGQLHVPHNIAAIEMQRKHQLNKKIHYVPFENKPAIAD